MLSLRQLSCHLRVARHLCRVCGASDLSTAVPQTPALRPQRLVRHAAPISGGTSRLRWHRCSSRAADAAIVTDATSQQRRDGHAQAAAVQQGPSFQDAIAALQAYWSGKGCAVCLPHNTEVC